MQLSLVVCSSTKRKDIPKTYPKPGKADTNEETAFETARREATEEIGLPDIGQPLLSPFRVEHICELPANLARNELVVRPCVALLHSHDAQTGKSADPETALIPRLDAKEVAAVFTAPFHDFLKLKLKNEHGERGETEDDWYQGSWTYWHETDWRSMHATSTLTFVYNNPLENHY